MRFIRSARVREAGLLLLELAGLAVLLWDRVGKDAPIRDAVAGVLRRARSIG